MAAATRKRAVAALRRMDKSGLLVTFDSVAKHARVTRSWLYTTRLTRRDRAPPRSKKSGPIRPASSRSAARLALTRYVIAADRGPCVNCGHNSPDPDTTLIAAIAGQRLTRHDRQRSGPRTPAQRDTEGTRDVTYEITITPPELPKTTKPARVLGSSPSEQSGSNWSLSVCR
jgi:hypothetical protein